MDQNYYKGELLKIHTKNNETIEGRFYGMDEYKSMISLYDVKESSDIKCDGMSHYYGTEIRSIVKLPNPEKQIYLKMSSKEYEEFIKISKRYIYINQVDHNFHKAIEDLNDCSYIAVSTDGTSMGRKCKMPFIVLTTSHQIYIFDIHVMQYHAFDAGLKKLLESNEPKKIIHDCRKISDCLYHKHNVKLNAVFDTMVGDLIITKNKNGLLPTHCKTLPECLTAYLGLPNFKEEKLDIVQCTERPLKVEIKEKLAKNIVFIHRLSEVINDQMLMPFVRGTEFLLDNLRNCDDFKAWELSSKYQQLPKEFTNAIEY